MRKLAGIRFKKSDKINVIIIILGEKTMKRDEMPVGFSMALAQNPEAMQKFAMLSEEKKKQIIDGTHSVKSKQEMHEYVNRLRNS